MTDELRDDNDEDRLDLSAWEAPLPPSDLADGVLARMGGTAITPSVPDQTAPREQRRGRALLIAGVAAACLVGAVGVYALVQGTRRAAPVSGAVVAERAQALSLETARAELDPGARVSWRREGGELRVEQAAGTVAWRVDGGERLVIDAGATVASVEATGASLRVEVKMNQADARVLGGAALTAAVVSMVTVVVYEGHVKVSGSAGQPTVIVQPGSTYTVTPPGPAPGPTPTVVDEPPVVGATVPSTADDGDATSLADVRIRGNESATIHATTFPVAVELEVAPYCALAIGNDGNSPSLVQLGIGVHPYSIECEGKTTAHGMITVVRDAAKALVPSSSYPANPITADGRSYKISSANRHPRIEVRGGTGTLHVVHGNVDRTFADGIIPEGALEPGTYSFWYDAAAKPSTLEIIPDESTPVLQLTDAEWGADEIRLAGEALTYSQLTVRSINVPIDIDGRFDMAVPVEDVVALRLAHPHRGVHYFVLRAPKRSTVAVAPTTLGRAQIMTTMNAAKAKLQACTKKGTPGLRGKVMFEIEVAPAGNVVRAAVTESYDEAVNDCMLGVAKQLRFAKATASTSFKYPVMVENPPDAVGCDSDKLKDQGMRSINMGQHAHALQMFEAALRCKDDPYLRQLAFMEACASGNSPKAKVYYKKLTPKQQEKFRQICIRQKPPVAFDDGQAGGGVGPGESEPAVGYLEVFSKPEARILVDGVSTGLTTPITGKQLKLAVGKHKITFIVGNDRFSYPVVIKAGSTERMSKDLQ